MSANVFGESLVDPVLSGRFQADADLVSTDTGFSFIEADQDAAFPMSASSSRFGGDAQAHMSFAAEHDTAVPASSSSRFDADLGFGSDDEQEESEEEDISFADADTALSARFGAQDVSFAAEQDAAAAEDISFAAEQAASSRFGAGSFAAAQEQQAASARFGAGSFAAEPSAAASSFRFDADAQEQQDAAAASSARFGAGSFAAEHEQDQQEEQDAFLDEQEAADLGSDAQTQEQEDAAFFAEQQASFGPDVQAFEQVGTPLASFGSAAALPSSFGSGEQEQQDAFFDDDQEAATPPSSFGSAADEQSFGALFDEQAVPSSSSLSFSTETVGGGGDEPATLFAEQQAAAVTTMKQDLVHAVHVPSEVFWVHQIREHVEIVETLLNGHSEQGEAIKAAAYLLIVLWIALDQAVQEEFAQQGHLLDGTVEGILSLTSATTEFFKALIQVQTKPDQWLGWFFPSLIQHMVDEQELFMRFLAGDLPLQEEILGYIAERKTAHAATEKLVDPTEHEAADALIVVVNQLEHLEEAVAEAFESRDEGHVRQVLQTAVSTLRHVQEQDLADGVLLTDKTILNAGPGLYNIYDHEAREGEHQLWRLEQILAGPEPLV